MLIAQDLWWVENTDVFGLQAAYLKEVDDLKNKK